MKFDHGGIAKASRSAAFGREQIGGLVRFAVHVEPMVGDGSADDLVFGGDGLPFLRRREDRLWVHHAAVLKQHRAGGLERNDFNREPASLVSHERQRNGLHSTDVLDARAGFVHAHHEGRRRIGNEVV